MDSRTNVQHLFEDIKDIPEEAAHELNEAAPYDPDILTSIKENLNKLLPGERNLQFQSHFMGLLNAFLQRQAGQSVGSSPADVINLAPEVLQPKVLCTESDKKQQQPATLDTNKSNVTNDSELIVRGTDHSSGPSGEDKPFILVFMHHCRNPSHMTNDNCFTKCQPSSDNGMHIFHCAYHDSVGLLECQENDEAVNMVHAILQSCADSQAEIPPSSVTCTQQDMEQQPMATKTAKTLNITKDGELHRGGPKPVDEGSESEQRMRNRQSPVQRKRDSTGHSGAVKVHVIRKTSNLHDAFMKKMNLQIELCSEESCSVILFFCPMSGTDKGAAMSRDTETSAVSSHEVLSQFNQSSKKIKYSLVKVNMLVAGETFNNHEIFIQKLKLQIERCSAESSSVILVFCPVVSRIGTDMEATMAKVTEDKPVILVFMHHCHHPSHMTNITVQPSRRNIVQVVHCAFHETKGLLECEENEQAVTELHSALLRYVDSHAEVPPSHKGPTKVICTQSATDHSTASEGTSSTFGQLFKRKPNLTIVSSLKVHVLVAGETFNSHLIFIQKLKLQIEQHSAESCDFILVFCPVVSQLRTDMEAAMARVTVNKPVILVFMHHCHNPNHMINITVQSSRSNIVKVVHCAYHESTGLLRCQENEQAVAKVEATLKKYK